MEAGKGSLVLNLNLGLGTGAGGGKRGKRNSGLSGARMKA